MTNLSITIVLEHYGAEVSVPDTGWRAIRCPFHPDRSASASVNLDLGAFKCHACGMSGDALKLIQRQENTDFEGALEFARTILGTSDIHLPRAAKKRKPKRSSWRKGLFDESRNL